MIDDTRKLIFVHPEKSGGSSVERAFGAKIIRRPPENTLFREGRMHHMYSVPYVVWHEQVMGADAFKAKYPDKWATYRKIAIVRNPSTRFISRHRYFLKTDKALSAVAKNEINENGIWTRLLLEDIRQGNHSSFGPVMSQTNKLGDLRQYAYILKLERLAEDWQKMIKHLSLEGLQDIQHVNSSGKPIDVMEEIKLPSDRARLVPLLRQDLANFNYIIARVTAEDQNAILKCFPHNQKLRDQARRYYPVK